MTEAELKRVLKEHRRTLHKKPISKGIYLYAAWRERGEWKEVYLMPETRLEQLTHETLVAKLS